MGTRLILLALASVAVLSVSAEKARFDNFRILSVKVVDEKEREFLRELDEMSDSVDILSEVGNEVEMVVAPHKLADIGGIFERNGIQSEVKHTNFQELIDNEQPSDKSTQFSWSAYYNYDVIYEWLDQKLKENPQILTNVIVGRSFENRTIRGVKLSHKKGNPSVFIDAAIHAREWITPPTVTYFLNELLTSKNPVIVNLAQNIDWIIVPVFNIDGYSWSHTNYRLWRKTRQPYAGQCFGADPNRNFDVKWGSVGTSNRPCAETYGGPRPFSEPETLAISQLLKSIPNLRMYLTFHSFGQYLMFPYGFYGPPAPNHNDLMQVAKIGGEAIRQRYGTNYRVGRSSTTLYPAAGGSDDWAYAHTNASLSYIFELRSRSSFILPPNQIIPNSQEITDGLVAIIAEARKLSYL